MRYLLFILLFLFNIGIYAQSPLCGSYPTSFCCEYVSSVTINGKTYNGSTGYTTILLEMMKMRIMIMISVNS